MKKDAIILPRPLKSYFFMGCTEWNDIDNNERFIDLAYAFSNGFDLVKCIDEYICDGGSMGYDDVKSALCYLIANLRYSKSRSKDIELTEIVLADNLEFQELAELFRVELLIRFSYSDGENNKPLFLQKIITGEPVALYLDKHKKDANSIKEIICNPTGYKKVSEAWLKENNPWNSLAPSYRGFDLYSTTRDFVVDDDRALLKLYNTTKTAENHKYHLEIPAEPWQGNPLKARIIILSLNPGWEEKYNMRVALDFEEKGKGSIAEEIFMEKQRTLLFKAEGFFPRHQETADAISLLGANYWRGDDKKEGRLSPLKPNGMDDFEFYKKFAVVQYCAYTSKNYGGGFNKGEYLPTQKFTKELIRYIAYNRPEVKFVILRAENKWKSLLDADVWYKMLPNTIISKHYRVQRITRGNLGDEAFEELKRVVVE